MSTRRHWLATLTSAALALPGLAHAQEPLPLAPPATETAAATAAPPVAETAENAETAAPTAVPDAPATETEIAPPASEPVPELPSEAAPASEEPLELSAAELAELGLTSVTGESALDTSLRFWGFADFTASTMVGSKDNTWRGVLGRYPSFFVGSFNLYLSKNITERIRTMGEVRFTYLPNGADLDSRSGTLVSTTVTDYATNNLGSRWGGVMIQRIYVEATAHEWATLRIGQFLTPYGIWNIDHGSPTVIPVQRPSMLNQQLFPENQTGFELFGRGRVGSNHVLGYHATLSNGLGPVSEYRDLDSNKAVGGRAYWQYDRFGQLQLGGSAFYARDTASTDVPGLSATGAYQFKENITRQSDVLSLAADIRWAYKGLLLQSEFIAQQRKYTDKGRIGASSPLLGQWLAPQDDIMSGAYGLVGYRFEWLGIMPYAFLSSLRIRDPQTLAKIASLSIQGGLNIRPVDAFVIKLEYSYATWLEDNFISNDSVQMFNAQVAWAF